MEKTLQNTQPPSDALVVGMSQESDTIKRIVLQVQDPSLSFKPGQWVDFFIPGVSTFTGYSMCSSPHLLEDCGKLELAVKYSDYPPTLWVHTECRIGAKVQIRVGGSFFCEIRPEGPRRDVLLMGAGIGINPVYSIFQHFIHTNKQTDGIISRLCMLYSARSPKELVFKNQIVEMAKECPNVEVLFFSTRQNVDAAHQNIIISNDRISSSVVQSKIATLDKPSLHAYVCGPPAFIDDMEQYCLENGLGTEQIHYEKWW